MWPQTRHGKFSTKYLLENTTTSLKNKGRQCRRRISLVQRNARDWMGAKAPRYGVSGRKGHFHKGSLRQSKLLRKTMHPSLRN